MSLETARAAATAMPPEGASPRCQADHVLVGFTTLQQWFWHRLQLQDPASA